MIATLEYIAAKISLTNCMQKHFRQVCHVCKKYAKCKVYAKYVEAWIELQKSVKEQPTRVTNLYKEGCDVYIGRGSIWGNKYCIGKDGTREEVIVKYIDWILEKIKTDENFKEKMKSLRGKRLGCWCSPKECHGDVLVQCVQLQ